MAQTPVILQLPESLYERVRQIAADSHRPLEEVLLDSLALLFDDLPDNPALTPQLLDALSDEQLWAIVFRPLAWTQDVRLRELTALGKAGALSADERAEIERLVDQWISLIVMCCSVLKRFCCSNSEVTMLSIAYDWAHNAR